jgi:predicted DNA-binding transcriptional regulator AlpA
MKKKRTSSEDFKGNTLMLDDLLTYADLARLTGESIMTHRRRKMLGTGPRFLLIGGRHIRFRSSDVTAWLDSCANRQGAR